MSRTLLIIVVTIGTLSLLSCDDYQVINTSSPESKLVNLKTCNCEIVPKDEMTKLREQAEIGKSVGRYQMRNEGYRTWRFDTATGRSCILLAPEWDWKKPDVENQSCALSRN